jgi:hypothetical protein
MLFEVTLHLLELVLCYLSARVSLSEDFIGVIPTPPASVMPVVSPSPSPRPERQAEHEEGQDDEEYDAEWEEKEPEDGGAALTVEKTIELSLPLYKKKMCLDYARPGNGELAAWFRSLGLAGEFWRL